jgi:putative addiction module component (TIGR02574 family)
VRLPKEPQRRLVVRFNVEQAASTSYDQIMVRHALLNELKQMSSAERILLAQDLWDSVADDPEAWELSAAQKREIDRRLRVRKQRAKRGEKSASTWGQVKRRILRGK